MGATSSTTAPSPSPSPTQITTFSCPADNDALYTSSSKRVFRLNCDTDYTGNDLGWSAGTGLLDCVSQCNAKAGCAAVVYSWSKACYFKGSDAQALYSEGSQAAILNRLRPLSSSSSVVTTPTVTVKPTRTSSKTANAPGKTTSRVSSGKNAVKTLSFKTTRSSQHTTLATRTSKLASPKANSRTKSTISSSTVTSSSHSGIAISTAPTSLPGELTFLAMGDSITYGYLANESYNSYRLGMIDLLTGVAPLWLVDQPASGSAMYQAVHAVGYFHSGNFTENASEGYDGGDIDTIHKNWLARYSKYARTPDVATILAGIHDIANNATVAAAVAATQRIGSLADDLMRAYPNITVIVGTLTPVTVTGWDDGIAAFNGALPKIVQRRATEGKKIMLVDTGGALTEHDDLADFVHPNAQGYRKLARTYYDGLKNASGRGWL